MGSSLTQTAQVQPNRAWLKTLLAPFRPWLLPAEGWSTFVFLVTTHLIVVLSVEQAEWIKPTPSLKLTAVIALFSGFLLAKAKVPTSLLHAVGLLMGVEVVVRQTAAILPGATLAQQRLELWERLGTWMEIVRTGGISSDTIPFALLLVSLAWLIGYVSSWSAFRWHQAWGAVIPSGVAILVNLSYLPERFAFFFVLFLFSAMLLVMRLNFSRQEQRWKGASIQGRIGWRFLIGTVWLSLAIITTSWLLPLASSHSQLTAIWERLSTPWERAESEFNRLFASLTSSKVTALHTFGDTLPLRGSVSLGNQIVFKVKSDAAGYWRANAYDVYTGKGWVSGVRISQPFGGQYPTSPGQKYAKRKEITQKIWLNTATEVLFAAGEPLRVDIPARSQLTATPTFTINLEDSSRDMELAPSVRSTAGVIRAAAKGGEYPVSLEEILRYLPPDMRALSVTRRGQRISTIEVAPSEPENRDIASLRSSERLGRWQEYTVVSTLSVASPEDLKKAGTEYPSWVANRFLQVPAELPARVRRLSERLTKDASTPFDKVRAIEAHLRGLGYSLDIAPPPFDRDAVDYFLFTSKAGYCDYFASAMVVMLRSVGVPARVASGYVTGDYDVERGTYVVRESHAHSWPEVFFPGYGWVEWEPTPAWPPVERVSDAPGEDVMPALDDSGDPDEPFDDELFFDDEEGIAYYGGWVPSFLEWARWPAGFIPLAGVLALAVLWFLSERGLGKLNYAAQSYERMCRLASLAGLGHRSQETPLEYARRLSSHLQGTPVSSIVDSYVKSQYGGKVLSDKEQKDIKTEWATLRGKLLRYLLSRNRKSPPE